MHAGGLIDDGRGAEDAGTWTATRKRGARRSPSLVVIAGSDTDAAGEQVHLDPGTVTQAMS